MMDHAHPLARALRRLVRGALLALAAAAPAHAGLDEEPPPLAVVEMEPAPAMPPDATEPAGPVAAPRGNPLWARPIDSLRATRDRPLFSPTRRPATVEAPTPPAPEPPPAGAAAPPAAARPRLRLVGTMTGADGGYAFFLDGASDTPLSLRTGEAHQGWVLRAVTPRDATLAADGDIIVLALPARDTAGIQPAAPRPPVAPPPSAQPPRPPPTRAAHVVVPLRPARTPLENYPDH